MLTVLGLQINPIDDSQSDPLPDRFVAGIKLRRGPFSRPSNRGWSAAKLQRGSCLKTVVDVAFFGRNFYEFDARGLCCLFKAAQHVGHLCGWPLQNRFNRPVAAIAHPSDYT